MSGPQNPGKLQAKKVVEFLTELAEKLVEAVPVARYRKAMLKVFDEVVAKIADNPTAKAGRSSMPEADFEQEEDERP